MAVNVHVEVGSINIYFGGAEHPLVPVGEQPLATSPVAEPETTDEFVVTDNRQTSETTTPASDEISDEQDARFQRMIDEYEEDEINVTARVNFLRNLTLHASPARKLEGFQTNHQRRPRARRAVNKEQHSEKVMASEALENACGVCALSKTCELKNDIDAWLDIHPYAKGHPNTRRPGSRPVKKTESRDDFLEVLAKDPRAHCDPAKRPKA